MAKKEFFRIITIFLVLFSLPFVIYFTDKEPNQEFCIDNIGNDSLYMSRVPLDNQNEDLREYYINNTWIKVCN